MKKFIALILTVVICLSLVACGNSTDNETNVTYYKIGDTVSSDILEFTLDEAALAIALSNTLDKSYGSPKEYNSQTDSNNPYVCAKGHTYAAFTYTIKNLDRTNYNGKLPLVSAEYKDVISDKQVDCSTFIEAKNEWSPTGNNASSPVYSWYFVLEPEQAEKYRSYIDIPVEADNLSDDFILIVNLPTSDGSTISFEYLITNNI